MKLPCHHVLLLLFYDINKHCIFFGESYKKPVSQMLVYFNKNDEIIDIDFNIYTTKGLSPMKIDKYTSKLMLNRLGLSCEKGKKSIKLYGRKFYFK